LRSKIFPTLFVILSCLVAFGQREQVLKQIDLPHPYYYCAMYVPQLTTGPSSAAWLREKFTSGCRIELVGKNQMAALTF